MSDFWAVFRKEWLSVLKNRRGLFVNLLTFGLLLPLLSAAPYGLIAFSALNQLSDELTVAVSGLEYAPKLAEYSGGASQIVLVPVEDAEAEVRRENYRFGILIPPDFEEKLARGETARVEIVSKQAQVINTAGTRVERLLQQYKRDLVAETLARAGLEEQALEPFSISLREIVTESRFQRSYLSWMLVFFVTFYAFSLGAPNAIKMTAGEKEELSMEVLLLSPASRAGILLGKIFYVLTYGFANLALTAISYTVTLAGGLYLLAGLLNLENLSSISEAMANPSATQQELSLPEFSLAGIGMVILLTIFTVFIFTVLQFMVGIWARNENQASSILSVINLLPGLASVVFFIDSYQPDVWHYLIPIFSQTLLIPDMLVNRFEALPLLISFAGSGLFIAASVGLMVWMMNREDIIYRY